MWAVYGDGLLIGKGIMSKGFWACRSHADCRLWSCKNMDELVSTLIVPTAN